MVISFLFGKAIQPLTFRRLDGFSCHLLPGLSVVTTGRLKYTLLMENSLHILRQEIKVEDYLSAQLYQAIF